MIPVIGEVALVLALVMSVLQAIVPLAGARRWGSRAAAFAPHMAGVVFSLMTISFAALVYAYVTSDFSVLNVVANSHSLKPVIYKITGVWGNHEGSMILWIWMLAFWGFCVARSTKLPPVMQSQVLAVCAMITAGFLLFSFLTSNPFIRLSPPATEGMDLNPVLQDLGLAIHPPLLYAGYVGFSIAFCFAVAALMDGRVNAVWAAYLRPWVLWAWVALTSGIAAGGIWAYYELGWGGYWAWDPVENASLMPWLAGTALLHSVSVLERRGALGNWTVFLAILAFSFSLLGTFLVRSGVLTSVHSFATDPLRGMFILGLLVVAIGGAFLFYALRAPAVREGASFAPVSRETALLLNNVILFTFCMTVLMGTLYPIFTETLGLGQVSVGPPYYMATLLPLLPPFALLLGGSMFVAWRRGNFKRIVRPLLIFGAVFLPLLPLMLHKPWAVACVAAGGWVLFATLYDLWRKRGSRLVRRYYGMALAHAGVGVVILGLTVNAVAAEEKLLWMAPGDRVEMGAYEIAFLGVQLGMGPNYERSTGIFTVGHGYMAPERRWYPVQEKLTSEVALYPVTAGLLYLTIGDEDKRNPGRWAVRVYYHPAILIALIGVIMIAGGGLLSLSDRRDC